LHFIQSDAGQFSLTDASRPLKHFQSSRENHRDFYLRAAIPLTDCPESHLEFFAELRTPVKLAFSRRLFASVNCRGHPAIMSSTSRVRSRLDLISKHLDSPKPFLELNTPFSSERSSHWEDEHGNRIKRDQKPPVKKVVQEVKKTIPELPKKMSNQAPHPALLIPGPIEFDDAVLTSMSHYRYDMTPPGYACSPQY
jgi:hypothetical protein